MALTLLSKPTPVIKLASKVPSAFNRAILPTVLPLNSSKPPPMIIFPSDWSAIFSIKPEAPEPVTKLVSTAPFGKIFTILLAAVPLKLVKLPTKKILPSDCNTIL